MQADLRSIPPGDRAGWHASLLSRSGSIERLPIAAALLMLTLAVGLWWALTTREQAQLRRLVDGRAASVLQELQALVGSRNEALERMAARWEARGGTPRSEWEADATNYLEHEPGFAAIEWADAGSTVRWVIPMQEKRAVLDLAADQTRRTALELARETGGNTLSDPIDLIPGERGLLIYSPVIVNGQFDGLIIGVLSPDDLFDRLLPEPTQAEVSIALLDEGEQFYGPARSGLLYDKWRVEHEMQALNQSWRVEVWPKAPLLDSAMTAIPTIIIALGTVVSSLLSLTIVLARRSLLRAEDLERTVETRTAELKETIAALAESERKHSQLYENAPDMFVSIDAVYAIIVRCNQTLADTIGVSKHDLIGQPATALYHPDCLDDFRQAFAQFLEIGEVQDTALKLLRSDGTTIDVLVNDSAIRNRRGQILYSSAVIRDVTALKAAEHERDRHLRAERGQRRIAESLGRVALALSATLELESLVELICKESVSLFGAGAAFVWLVEGEELVGRAGYGMGRQHFIGTRVPLDDPETLAARVIRDRRPIYVNNTQSSQGANPRLVQLFGVRSILGVPLLKGLQPIGALMILDTEDPERFGTEDLAMATVLGSHVAVAVENARLYEQERTLAQMKDDFIAHVSHELRTPLHTLRGFIQLIQSGKVKDPEVERDFLRRAAHDADRLTEQVSELLEAAHIDATGLRLEYEAVDVGELVRQTLDSIRIIADDRGVALRNFAPLRGPVIRSDERRLRQVVRNLVENAIQFSESGSVVEVQTEQRADKLLLTVRDHGPGIAPQAIGQLFDRYYQVANTARREKGGVGLGLYITRKIVDAHGGRIEVESSVGVGSTFRAILPLDVPEPVEDGRL